jgi:chromosome partitioning protein
MREETPFDILHKADNRIHRDIKDITKGYNHCLIDCPPRGQDITLSALLASRLCVIPVRPSPLDIWSGREFLEVIAEARKHNKGLQAKLLIAQKVAGTIPAKEIREALQTLKRGIFNTEIGFRVAYVKAMTEGKTILEYERNGAAAMEITNLRDEILKRG